MAIVQMCESLSPVSGYEAFRNDAPNLISDASRFFKIKVYGDGLNKLVGVYGLLNLIGAELTTKLIVKALSSKGDVQRFALRRGLTVTFYNY